MSNKENIAILSDTNLSSFKNLEEIDGGSEASMLELIVMLSFRLAGVVHVQSCTTVQKASDLYVAIWARNRGVVGGLPSHFGKRGR